MLAPSAVPSYAQQSSEERAALMKSLDAAVSGYLARYESACTEGI